MQALSLALWIAVVAVALAVIGLVLVRSDDPTAAPAAPSIVAGTPSGIAVLNATPGPMPTTTPEPKPPAATAAPTPAPTASATAAPTPAPATPVPSTPAPTPVVVAAAGPDDAVAAFYGNAAAGRFDAAYGLWSQRMRDTYPRAENLDGRFDDTSSIAFEQLYVAEQADGRATVQANFVETYESGSSRRFVGYWRMVRVDGRWLLDEPQY